MGTANIIASIPKQTKATAIDFLLPHTPVIDKANTLAFRQDADKAEHIVVGQQIHQLIEFASEHVDTRGDVLQLDESALAKRRIAEADIWTLSKYVDITNNMIANGTFAAAPGGLLISKSPFYFQGPIYDMSQWKFDADVRWWGVKFEMNDAMTEDIIGQLVAGASAVAIIALLQSAAGVTVPVAVLTAIVGLIMIVGAVRLMISSQGNGVCIYMPWVPPGANWISSR